MDLLHIQVIFSIHCTWNRGIVHKVKIALQTFWISSGRILSLPQLWEQRPDLKNNTSIPDAGTLGRRAVYRHHSVVVYDILIFAIPAFIALFLRVFLFVIAMFILISRQVTCSMFLHYMNYTSLGRAVYDAEHPNRESATSISATWSKEVGNQPIGIRAYNEQTLKVDRKDLPSTVSI